MALTLVDLTNTVTGTLPAANGGTGATSFPAPGANGNALISNGTTWTSTAISTKPFVTGTSMLFRQTAAPTGWTKVTSFDNYALRIVSGSASTGGSVAFTTAFASGLATASTTAGGTVGSTTLGTGEIPSHSHSINTIAYTNFAACVQGGIVNEGSASLSSGSTGGGGSHTHSFTGTGHTHTLPSFAVQYVDVIIANID
jgi:hypothetical protein